MARKKELTTRTTSAVPMHLRCEEAPEKKVPRGEATSGVSTWGCTVSPPWSSPLTIETLMLVDLQPAASKLRRSARGAMAVQKAVAAFAVNVKGIKKGPKKSKRKAKQLQHADSPSSESEDE
jgi:hypothetical protein